MRILSDKHEDDKILFDTPGEWMFFHTVGWIIAFIAAIYIKYIKGEK